MHAVLRIAHEERLRQPVSGRLRSCHNATENGAGLELWDLTKYDRLWGINGVENVRGDFKIDQREDAGPGGVFSYDWMHATTTTCATARA
ncbi:MAG: hypothetical protein ACLSVD_03335 [Eggerthellaceae bacterium]